MRHSRKKLFAFIANPRKGKHSYIHPRHDRHKAPSPIKTLSDCSSLTSFPSRSTLRSHSLYGSHPLRCTVNGLIRVPEMFLSWVAKAGPRVVAEEKLSSRKACSFPGHRQENFLPGSEFAAFPIARALWMETCETRSSAFTSIANA